MKTKQTSLENITIPYLVLKAHKTVKRCYRFPCFKNCETGHLLSKRGKAWKKILTRLPEARSFSPAGALHQGTQKKPSGNCPRLLIGQCLHERNTPYSTV